MTTNADQSRIWNGSAGEAWVAHAEHFDATLAPFGEAVIDRLDPPAGQRIVDIGCGAGATTIRLAALVTAGSVTGVDVSAPMLALARARADAAGVENVVFAETDVQADDLVGAPFDLAFSRFGVMFFTDPVLAFSRIAGALVGGGRFGFVCFQSPTENPFIVVPVGIASAHLGVGPPADPNGPNPFSLADPNRTRLLLADAGFTDVELEPGPVEAVLGTDDDLPGLARRVIEQNPSTSIALAAATPDVQATTLDAVAAALAHHCSNGLVTLGAATWIVTAAKRPA